MPDIYIGNTDNDWFDFLRARKPWEEVNFWKPTPSTFKAIDEGEFFAFRLKSPRAVIGGYGRLASAINVPIQFAWDGLGSANGCNSLGDLVDAIRRYRGGDVNAQSLFGCRVLVDPVFFDESDWFPVPDDWSANIVSGKSYSTTSIEGALLHERLLERTSPGSAFKAVQNGPFGFGDQSPQVAFDFPSDSPKFGNPMLVKPRLGQQAFRIKIAAAYGFACGISDTRVLPALEAAHVRPYSNGGEHSLNNGIFLRKDIHSVFDHGYVTFDTDYRLVVSERVKTDFNNGNEYRKLHGSKLKLPPNPTAWPSQQHLEWHRSQRFNG